MLYLQCFIVVILKLDFKCIHTPDQTMHIIWSVKPAPPGDRDCANINTYMYVQDEQSRVAQSVISSSNWQDLYILDIVVYFDTIKYMRAHHARTTIVIIGRNFLSPQLYHYVL